MDLQFRLWKMYFLISLKIEDSGDVFRPYVLVILFYLVTDSVQWNGLELYEKKTNWVKTCWEIFVVLRTSTTYNFRPKFFIMMDEKMRP